MLPSDRARFGPTQATLRDQRTITVRLLEPVDGPAIAEFYVTVPRADYRFYCPWPLTAENAQARVAARADTPRYVCMLGINDAGLVVGYAWYDWKHDADDTSHFGICIRRGYQEVGTGRAVTARLLEVAREVGPPHMHLTVQKANPRAVALYQKMGFQILREQTRGQVQEFPPEPEYLMQQTVRPAVAARRMLACGTLSYREESLERALEGIARGGFGAVEIGCVCGYCDHIRPEEMSQRDVEALRDQVSRHGLAICSIAGHIDLQFPLVGKGPEAAAEGYRRLRARIDVAAQLGVPIVNTGLGVAQPGENIDAFYDQLRKLLDHAGDKHVKIGLESHAGLTETARASLELCRRVNHPALGINHDAGNVRFYAGLDPVADLAAVAAEIKPWLVHVHIKDHRGGQGAWDFPPLGEGSIDFAALSALYRQIGFAGPYSLEIEFKGPGSTDPTPAIIDAGVAGSYAFMKKLNLTEDA